MDADLLRSVGLIAGIGTVFLSVFLPTYRTLSVKKQNSHAKRKKGFRPPVVTALLVGVCIGACIWSILEFGMPGIDRDVRERIRQLKSVRRQVPEDLFAQIQAAIIKDDAKMADNLLIQLEKQAHWRNEVLAETSYQRCRIAQDQYRMLQALELCDRAAALVPENIVYLEQAALRASELGQFDKAVVYYDRMLVISRKTGDRKGECRQLVLLGIANHTLGQYDKAASWFNQALAIYREAGDRKWEAVITGHLGEIYKALGQSDKAIQHFDLSLAIFRAIGFREGESAALESLGKACHSIGQYDKSIAYCNQSLSLSREIGHPFNEDSLLKYLGRGYQSLGQYAKAIDCFSQALAIVREKGDRSAEGDCLSSLGTVYRELGQFNKAIDHLDKALAIARETVGGPFEGKYLSYLGMVYKDMGQVDKAKDYFNQSFLILKENESKYADRVRELLAEVYVGNSPSQ